MRLHDVQVAISALNTADKIQFNQQNQGQMAQAQAATKLAEQADVKMTQTQQAQEEDPSKSMSETDIKQRQWKKQQAAKSKRANQGAGLKEENPQKNQTPGSGQIIDIKA